MSEASMSRIDELEQRLDEIRAELHTLQRDREPEPVDEFTFVRSSGETVSLQELIGDSDDLIMVHNMGRSCAFCTMWADGFEGLRPHLEDRASFVVSSPDAPAEQRDFAASRGWTFDMVSTQGTSFAADMGFATPEGQRTPGVSTFHRTDDGDVVRVASRAFGPGDEFNAAYHLFDLLNGGRGDWHPQLTYDDE